MDLLLLGSRSEFFCFWKRDFSEEEGWRKPLTAIIGGSKHFLFKRPVHSRPGTHMWSTKESCSVDHEHMASGCGSWDGSWKVLAALLPSLYCSSWSCSLLVVCDTNLADLVLSIWAPRSFFSFFWLLGSYVKGIMLSLVSHERALSHCYFHY